MNNVTKEPDINAEDMSDLTAIWGPVLDLVGPVNRELVMLRASRTFLFGWREGFNAAADMVAGPKPPPEPEMCRHPAKCAGLSYCKSDPACNE